jgi:CubicO group peptidase (beta-lactamase class C family)
MKQHDTTVRVKLFSCFHLVLVACAALLAASVASAAANAPKDSGTTFAKDALAPFAASGQLPGAINVFYKDGLQETACVGYADVAAKRPITMNDVYMQCSQTKGFCGVTIAILLEEGKIALDDPVSNYLPEFKELWVLASSQDGVKTLNRAKNTLTIRMVMNHTGGFPFEICAKQGDLKGGGWSGGAPLRQTAAIAAACPLLFEPGTKVQYSNTGIDIGAAIVEVVTGQRWENFLKARVLDPLGMASTWFWPTDEQLKTQVEMYDCVKDAPAKYREQNPMQQRPYNDAHVFASAGAGLWTTADDQLKFYKMLMNLGADENGVRILKEETVKNLLAVSTRPKGMGGYSLGLSAPEEDADDAWFGHGGAWGTNCMVNWHRKELKLWAVQLNGKPRPWDKARADAEKKLFKYAINNAGADAYTGRVK